MQCSTAQQDAQTLDTETLCEVSHLQPQHNHAAVNAHHLRRRHMHMSNQEPSKLVANVQHTLL